VSMSKDHRDFNLLVSWEVTPLFGLVAHKNEGFSENVLICFLNMSPFSLPFLVPCFSFSSYELTKMIKLLAACWLEFGCCLMKIVKPNTWVW